MPETPPRRRQPTTRRIDTKQDAHASQNQRRSRARRKQYLEELEDKLRKCEQTGAEASSEMQIAARRVLEENVRLRNLLKQHGLSEDDIDVLKSESNDMTAAVLSPAQELAMQIGNRRSCSGRSSNAPDEDVIEKHQSTTAASENNGSVDASAISRCEDSPECDRQMPSASTAQDNKPIWSSLSADAFKSSTQQASTGSRNLPYPQNNETSQMPQLASMYYPSLHGQYGLDSGLQAYSQDYETPSYPTPEPSTQFAPLLSSGQPNLLGALPGMDQPLRYLLAPGQQDSVLRQLNLQNRNHYQPPKKKTFLNRITQPLSTSQHAEQQAGLQRWYTPTDHDRFGSESGPSSAYQTSGLQAQLPSSAAIQAHASRSTQLPQQDNDLVGQPTSAQPPPYKFCHRVQQWKRLDDRCWQICSMLASRSDSASQDIASPD